MCIRNLHLAYTSKHRLSQNLRFTYLWSVAMKYSTLSYVTKSFTSELLSSPVTLIQCLAEYLTQLATSYQQKCKQIMPTYLGLTLQNAKATSWLNASKGNDPINEKSPCFSFNDEAMGAQRNREHSISRTDSSTNRPENFVVLLFVGQEKRKSNSLHATYYFLYRVFLGYSGVVKNEN